VSTSETIPPTARTTLKRLPKRGEFNREAIEAILDEALICHIAYVHEGRPFMVPTGFARDGRWLCFHGARSNRTLRALLEGEACISVTLLDGLVQARSAFQHSMNYRSLVIFASGEEITGRPEKIHAMRRVVEHIVPGRWEQARQPNDHEIDATLMVRVPIEECSAKVRSGPPIDDEPDMNLGIWAGVIPARIQWGPPLADPQLPAGMEPPANVSEYRRP
jgi:nitroimidazol reductase NimA-like FMN-containing flavoprotein (pyridoxamine 5'-phosphate oxidase superfamily)